MSWNSDNIATEWNWVIIDIPWKKSRGKFGCSFRYTWCNSSWSSTAARNSKHISVVRWIETQDVGTVFSNVVHFFATRDIIQWSRVLLILVFYVFCFLRKTISLLLEGQRILVYSVASSSKLHFLLLLSAHILIFSDFFRALADGKGGLFERTRNNMRRRRNFCPVAVEQSTDVAQ
jgi:hypothetical protein